MLIINKRSEKRTKLHVMVCPICLIEFGSYRNTSKVCSKQCSNKLNGLNKFKSITKKCVTCGRDFLHKPSQDKRGYKHTFCNITCRFPNKKLNLPRGQYYSYDGYIVLNKTQDGRKQVKLHRYIMEQSLKKHLSSQEIVHHINHDKLDNRIENLQVVTRREHNQLHKFLTR